VASDGGFSSEVKLLWVADFGGGGFVRWWFLWVMVAGGGFCGWRFLWMVVFVDGGFCGWWWQIL
jgi:hypothetical protein